MLIISIVLLVLVLVLYAVPIIKSRTRYKYDDLNDYTGYTAEWPIIKSRSEHPDWIYNSLILATAFLGLGISSIAFHEKSLNSFLNTLNDAELQKSYVDLMKQYIVFAGGFKQIFIRETSILLGSLAFTYFISFLGNGFNEARKGLLLVFGIFMIVLLLTVFGFAVFTKNVATVLGIISTILGILISFRTLFKTDKTA